MLPELLSFGVTSPFEAIHFDPRGEIWKGSVHINCGFPLRRVRVRRIVMEYRLSPHRREAPWRF